MSLLTPIVIEQDHRGERSYDIWSRLLKDRLIFIGGAINERRQLGGRSAVVFGEWDPKADITMMINSPGGVVDDGLAILDAMNYVKPDVATICYGKAASMGAVLLAAGTKGKRSALPHSRVMIHQPLGGAGAGVGHPDSGARDPEAQGTSRFARRPTRPVEQIAKTLTATTT